MKIASIFLIFALSFSSCLQGTKYIPKVKIKDRKEQMCINRHIFNAQIFAEHIIRKKPKYLLIYRSIKMSNKKELKEFIKASLKFKKYFHSQMHYYYIAKEKPPKYKIKKFTQLLRRMILIARDDCRGKINLGLRYKPKPIKKEISL